MTKLQVQKQLIHSLFNSSTDQDSGDFTSLQQRLQEVLQAVGEAAHHIAGVAVLRQEEGQLEVWVLLQLDFPPITPRQLICCVFCHCHHVVYQFLYTNTHTGATHATQASGSEKRLGGCYSPSVTVIFSSWANVLRKLTLTTLLPLRVSEELVFHAFVLQAGCKARPGHSGSWS